MMFFSKYRWHVAVALLLIGIVVFSRRSLHANMLLDGLHEDDKPHHVAVTLVQNATQTGAVCLDGSSPAYHIDRGSGSGSRNWLVFLEGGGWCEDHARCLNRSTTRQGSSTSMKNVPFDGILSRSRNLNPDFFNWNRVWIRYCDGASFGGNVTDSGQQNLFYRGERIWKAVISELLLRHGMMKVEKALLTGCSAGGVASMLHCNSFKELLPSATHVKCLSDGGYFMDVEDVHGRLQLRSLYEKVVQLQNLQERGCHGAHCLFLEDILQHVQPPVFILNSGYDNWQIQNAFFPEGAGEDWSICRKYLTSCSENQLRILEDYRGCLLKSMSYAQVRDGWRIFVTSCFTHCQSVSSKTWNHVKVGDKTIMQAVGDWYFERNSSSNYIDCPYPCNPTCPK